MLLIFCIAIVYTSAWSLLYSFRILGQRRCGFDAYIMNGYFIHTIELNKNITYKELEKIKDNLHCFPKNKGSKNYSWRSTHYKSSGIIIDIHKRTNREMFSGDYDKNYNLKLVINPSRLLV